MVKAAAAAAAALLLGSAEGVRVKSHRLETCGQNGLSSTNIKGGDATECAWNWQVGLVRPGESKPFCGGVLIESDWVLTSARCIHLRPVKYGPAFDVVAGEYTLNETSGTEQIRSAALVIKHPDFKLFSMGAHWDFALVRLNEPVDLKKGCVGTICLPTEGSDVVNGQSCWTTGWKIPAFLFRERLVAGEAEIVSTEYCADQYINHSFYAYRRSYFDEGNFCAKGLKSWLFGQRYFCAVDRGGPLVCQNNATGIWSIYGVMSFGEKCDEAPNLKVWARVHAAVDWIRETLDANTGPPPTSLEIK